MHVSTSTRHSQCNLPIPLTPLEELEDRDRSYQSGSGFIATTRSFTGPSPLRQTFDYSISRLCHQRTLTPPQSLENIIQSQRSRSDISQLSSNPSTPRFAEPRPWRRSPSPVSDKEATPPGTSHLHDHQKSTTHQPDWDEKEVLPTLTDPAYQLRRDRYRISTPDRQLSRAVPDSPEMSWLRRRSLADAPARNASVATANEKHTVDQTTGVIGYDEKQSTFTPQLSLSSQIMQARTARVNAVVDMYIEPLLQDQATNGLTQSTFVVIPEVSSLGDPISSSPEGKIHELLADYGTVLPQSESLDMLVGFPSDLNVQVVRLRPAHSGHTGHSGRARDAFGDQGTRFWQQPAACQELDRVLRIRLVGMGMDVDDPAGFTAPFRKVGWTERGEQVGGTPNMGTPITPKSDRWKGDDWQAGLGIWQSGGTKRAQSSWEATKQEHLLPGQASLKVTLEDVCFRTQSAMGLYGTKTDKAIVIRFTIEA